MKEVMGDDEGDGVTDDEGRLLRSREPQKEPHNQDGRGNSEWRQDWRMEVAEKNVNQSFEAPASRKGENDRKPKRMSKLMFSSMEELLVSDCSGLPGCGTTWDDKLNTIFQACCSEDHRSGSTS